MAKYRQRQILTAYVPRHEWSAIVISAVIKEYAGGLFVRCICGKTFDYLQDQVNCPRCGRVFDLYEAEDETRGKNGLFE